MVGDDGRVHASGLCAFGRWRWRFSRLVLPGTTRSAAALELWGDALEGALVAFGNAPTALFHLLEGIEAGRLPRPAAVIALPVGFVGAAESKAAIAASDLPFITVHGTRGGSAMAASVVNALALIARQESQE